MPPIVFRAFASLFLFLLLLSPRVTLGQASLFIAADDPLYEDIHSAMLRGHLSDLNPTARPYTYAEVLSALPEDYADSPLLSRIESGVRRFAAGSGAGISGRAGVRITSNGRMDPVRLRDGGLPIHPFIETGIHWMDGPLIARAGARMDQYWDRDPDGLDSVLRSYGRNDQSYAGVMGKRGSAVIGRIGSRWGNSSALLVSDNPRSYDAIHIRLGSSKLSFRSMIGELDSITGDGRFTGTAGDDSVASGSERRWMAAHRLDWRPSPHFQISLQEAVLYSGTGSGLSLKYLNPTQVLIGAVDNRPKNDENNGFIGMSIWAQSAGWTMESQLMFDDFDLFFGDEPASFAASTDLTKVLGAQTTLSGRVEAVASRTYNTFQPEGRWTYLNRGLATQFSDYVSSEVTATWLDPYRGVRIEPYAIALWQGERDLRDPYRFDDSFGTILVGTVERTFQIGSRLRYDHANWAYLAVDAGVNKVQNAGHQQGESRTRAAFLLGFGMRWSIAAGRKDN
jgi:hypothetical protein